MSNRVALYALLTSFTGFTLDTVIPVMPDMVAGVTGGHGATMPLIVTLVIFGMVFGEIIFGPLADAYGRKPAILAGIAIFILGTICVLAAPTFEMMLLGRILQGLGVSGPKIGTRSLIRDQYDGAEMARVLSVVFGILIIVPMIAPLTGQLLGGIFGWRSVFWFLMALALTSSAWLLLKQPETLAIGARTELSIPVIFKNVKRISQHGRVMSYTIIAGLVFSVQLLFLSVALSIFDTSYGKADTFVYWFALLAACMGIASLANSRMVTGFTMQRMLFGALSLLTLSGGVLLIVLLIMNRSIPFWLFAGVMMIVFMCIGVVFGNINAMAMIYLGRIAGLGASIIASLSSLVAFGVATGLGLMHDGTPLVLALSFIVCGTMSLGLLKGASYMIEQPV